MTVPSVSKLKLINFPSLKIVASNVAEVFSLPARSTKCCNEKI